MSQRIDNTSIFFLKQASLYFLKLTVTFIYSFSFFFFSFHLFFKIKVANIHLFKNKTTDKQISNTQLQYNYNGHLA